MFKTIIKAEYISYKAFLGFKFDIIIASIICLFTLFTPLANLVAFYPSIGNLYLPIIIGYATLKTVFIIYADREDKVLLKIATSKMAEFKYFFGRWARNGFFLIGAMFIPILILMVRLAFYNGVDYNTVLIINGFHNLSFYIVFSTLIYTALAVAIATLIVIMFDQLYQCVLFAIGIIVFYSLIDNVYFALFSNQKVMFWLYLIPGATFSSSITSIRLSHGSWISEEFFVSPTGVPTYSAVPIFSALSTIGFTILAWIWIRNLFLSYKLKTRRKSKKY